MRLLKQFSFSIMLGGLLTFQAYGQKTKAPVLPAPVKMTSVEGITEYKLNNGLRVLLFPDPSKPTITVNITYLVGSRMEGYGETGMAHLLEHMVFKGSANHKNVPQELTNHGAEPNGTTWYDRTNYFETFSATDENLNWALSLESDRMVNSFIAEKDLKSEFSVVRNEFEMGENYPSSVLMERILSTAYLWHNYGKSTIGSKEDIEKVPIKNLQAFYKKYYQPDNAVLIVAGKINEAKTLALVNKYFGSIPKPKRVIDPTYTVEPTQDGERYVELKRVGDVQSVACCYHIVSGSHKDYPAFDVLSEVLTMEPSGRIYQNLVKSEKATTTYSWASALKEPGFLYINADVSKDKSLDDAKAELNRTLDELKTKPVTQEEVDLAKNKLLSNFDKLYRNTENIGYTLSEYIAMGDWRLFFLYRDFLKAVTPADVNRVADNYIMPSNRTLGVFIPTTDPKRATIPSPPNVAELVKDYKGEASLVQAEAFEATPDNIEKRTVRGQITGGAKYAFLQKTTRGGTVNATITLRVGDEKSLQNKSVISALTAAMLKRGAGGKTFSQIKEELDKLSSSLNIYGSGQNIYINVQSTKDNLPKVLALLDDVLHKPAFADDEFKTLKDENISNLEQQRSEPTSIGFIELYKILTPRPAGHIEYVMSPDEEVTATKAATLDEVKAFYKDFYNASNATVAFVGDFDANSTKAQLEKILGNWSSPQKYTRISSQYTDLKPQNKDIKAADKKNAVFGAGMQIKLKDDNPEYPALTLGDFIFGGGFLNSRLATRIRQKEGISYGVGSYVNVESKDEVGQFMAYAIYNPDNKAKLEAAFNEELNKLVTTGFTEDELKQAKAGFLQYRQNSRAEDRQLADKLNRYLDLGRNLAWDKSVDQKLEALTLKDLNEAVKKYIDPKKMNYIKVGDFMEKP